MSERRDWLTARPIAHRGLHDISAGIVENTASAVTAAIAGNYGIEVDLQISGDGEAMVHHDDELGRLTEGRDALAEISAAQIKMARFRDTSDRIMTLGELCDLVAGRSTLVLELKSRFDGDLRLAHRTAEVLANYRGPAAVMSFDPRLIEALRRIAPGIYRGMVAEKYYREWKLPPEMKRNMAWMLHAPRTRPQFLAYWVANIPSAVPLIARAVGLPLLAWTVRSAHDRKTAERFASQIIFEGFRP